jgi:quercetin dioxygenase-like cupin family protein
MADFCLALVEHRLSAGGALALPPTNRVVYVVDGAAKLASEAAAAGLAANSAWCGAAALAIDSAAGAILLCWELQPGATARAPADGRLVLAAPLVLDPAQPYLMRGDRVDFPVGGVAYKHRHQGPGIRRLLHGSIHIETQGKSHDVAPGEAWFETGPDPVFAAASTTTETAFVRVMVLPLALKGKSSISYVDDADRDKPKTQRYQVFVDCPIHLRVQA